MSIAEGKKAMLFVTLALLSMWGGGFITGYITPYVGNSILAWIVSAVFPLLLFWWVLRRFGRKTVADR